MHAANQDNHRDDEPEGGRVDGVLEGFLRGGRETWRLRNVAGDELPVCRLGEDFAGAADERGVGGSVALEAVHHPGGGIAEIAVDPDDAGLLRVSAVRLAGDIVVRGAGQSAFQFLDATRDGVEIGGDGLLTRDGHILVWR